MYIDLYNILICMIAFYIGINLPKIELPKFKKKENKNPGVYDYKSFDIQQHINVKYTNKENTVQ
ncbi:hypothetical protein [Tenacibaculum ovolyticum]|uniref:hypothetical protein n=1 Tax=Tenacibaculum ovolyticum TaxID=104270 RepID=UPI000AE703B9|nr:hypothetical protein [Tenacibaculum ovolyticum]